MQKNKYILPLMVFVMALGLQAVHSKTVSCVDQKSNSSYNLASNFSRGIQNISGLNYLAARFAESKISKQLHNYVDGDIKVKIDSFSATDLAAGKFKKFSVNGKNISFNDFYMTSIDAESTTDMIHVDYKSNPVAVLTPINVAFNGVITENDLNRTVSSSNYQKKLKNIKLGSDLIRVSFLNPKVKLENNRIIINADVQISGTPVVVPVEINSGLKISNNMIILSDVKLNSAGMGLGVSFPENVYTSLNPFLYSIKELKLTNQKLNLEDVSIEDNQIKIKGSLWLPKSTDRSTISNKS